MKILNSRFFGRIKLYREINILVYGKKKREKIKQMAKTKILVEKKLFKFKIS